MSSVRFQWLQNLNILHLNSPPLEPTNGNLKELHGLLESNGGLPSTGPREFSQVRILISMVLMVYSTISTSQEENQKYFYKRSRLLVGIALGEFPIKGYVDLPGNWWTMDPDYCLKMMQNCLTSVAVALFGDEWTSSRITHRFKPLQAWKNFWRVVTMMFYVGWLTVQAWTSLEVSASNQQKQYILDRMSTQWFQFVTGRHYDCLGQFRFIICWSFIQFRPSSPDFCNLKGEVWHCFSFEEWI